MAPIIPGFRQRNWAEQGRIKKVRAARANPLGSCNARPQKTLVGCAQWETNLVVGLPTDLIPGPGERRPNIIRRHDKPVVAKDVALADLSSERLYVGMAFLLQHSLLARQRGSGPW